MAFDNKYDQEDFLSTLVTRTFEEYQFPIKKERRKRLTGEFHRACRRCAWQKLGVVGHNGDLDPRTFGIEVSNLVNELCILLDLDKHEYDPLSLMN